MGARTDFWVRTSSVSLKQIRARWSGASLSFQKLQKEPAGRGGKKRAGENERTGQ